MSARGLLACLAASLALVAALLVAASPAGGWTTTTTTSVAPGIVHRVLVGGRADDAWRHRVVVGSAADQAVADALLAKLEAAGEEPRVHYDDGRYHLFVDAGERRRDALELRRRLAEAGFAGPLVVEAHGHDVTDPGGPFVVHLLEVDPTRARVEVVDAADAAIGLETTRDLAVRHGAAAAVNGGYYRVHGLLRGDAHGVLQIDGDLVSEPYAERGAVGLWPVDGTTRTLFGRPAVTVAVRRDDGATIVVDGVDRRRDAVEAVLFTPRFHRTTLTAPGGLEVAVADGRVVELRHAGSSPIPPRGFVLSFDGDAPASATAGWRVGQAVTVEERWTPAEWATAEDVVGGGPLLVVDGAPRDDWAAESIARVFALARHPRTAFGVRADGTILLLAVDGRQPGYSVGMSLPELADLLVELGAVEALNLDGGGSTTMVIGDAVVNRTSDRDGPRWNGDGLLLFPRAAASAEPAPEEGR